MKHRAVYAAVALCGLVCTGLTWPVAMAQTAALETGGQTDWAQALAGAPGDATRGAAIVASRQSGLCLLCHPAPIGDRQFQGNLAPDLAGAGSRWTAPQLRERIADARQINPDSIMPRYFRTDGLQRVSPQARGKPLLSGQEIEDVIAYLLTLKH